jgi:hypothetical protein
VSGVGDSDRIGFISNAYDRKTGVRSGTDWVRLIELLDLRLHRVVTSPHYGDGTNDGTPAGKNRRQDGRQKVSNARKGERKSKGN